MTLKHRRSGGLYLFCLPRYVRLGEKTTSAAARETGVAGVEFSGGGGSRGEALQITMATRET